MTRYILTSVYYQGAIQINYDENGLMVFYSVLDAVLTKSIKANMLEKIPRYEADLPLLNARTAFFTIKRADTDLSFKNFWNEYGVKIHPHRCEPIWDKMSEVNKLAALQGIAAYFAYSDRKGIAKANPENYLKKQYWKTDWKNEK